MNKHVKLDPARQLAREVAASEVLLSQMREIAAGDADFLADLVEGQTGLFELIGKLDEDDLEDATAVAGLDVTIAKLTARKKAAEKRSETRRTMIALALDSIGLKTHRTPLGTITVSPKRPVAMVIEESDVPTRFWKSADPTLDKKALNAALLTRQAALDEAGAIEDPEARQAARAAAEAAHPAIPGTTLSNGGLQLAIRR